MRLPALIIAFAFSAAASAAAQPDRELLWPGGAPGAVANGGPETVRISEQGDHVVSNVHQPSIVSYLPAKTNYRLSVIVIPGGGHRELWTDHEGHNIARFLSERGIAAYVLQYRLARAPNSTYTVEGDALNDVKRAIRWVRARDSSRPGSGGKIGIMGFSAGGQLASLATTRFDAGDKRSTDPIEAMSSRPDFAALVYPGPWPNLDINAGTPPMWLLCGSDDRPEIIAGITDDYLKLRAAKVPAELLMYDHVAHGFGLRATNTGPTANWLQQFVDWLAISKFAEDTK